MRLTHAPGVAKIVALAVALAFGACGDDDDGGDPNALLAEDLSDGEILAMAMALNAGEVMTSEPALTKAASDAVRGFADDMISEHVASMQRLQALGIAPVESSVTEDLAATATQVLQQLEPLSGEPFDLAYMGAQLSMHQEALPLIQEVLLPQVDDAELRAELGGMQTAVTRHIQEAQQIQAVVGIDTNGDGIAD